MILAGEKLPGVYPAPCNSAEKRENVERVLQFMQARRVRKHHINSQGMKICNSVNSKTTLKC